MTGTLAAEAAPLLAEIEAVFAAMPPDALDGVAAEILAARRLLGYGQGRAGLVVQGLVMRLHHLGLDAHVVGAMSAPPVAAGDLLLLCAATGDLPTGLALAASAKRAGARVALVTGVSAGPAHASAAAILHIPAKTMAGDPASALPLGSQFELAFALAAEMLVARIAAARRITEAAMAARHANLL